MNGSNGGDGGSSGGYAMRILDVTPGEICTYTVGAGGAQTTAAYPAINGGGDTLFNCIDGSITGGGAAASLDSPGVGSGGTINIAGGNGQRNNGIVSGGGSAGVGEWGGGAQRGRSSATPDDGEYGGGGSGGPGLNNYNGAAGGDGWLAIYY